MPAPRQLFARRMAEALAVLLSQKHPTAKQIARAYKIDPTTAENLRKGHLSVPTLEKVVRVEGWSLWDELGAEMMGQTRIQHLQSVIEQEANEQAQREAARDQFRSLEERAAELVDLHHRSAA